MEAFAWTGVGVAALLITAWTASWITGLLSSPIGRWILTIWALITLVVWGVLGGIYLIIQAV